MTLRQDFNFLMIVEDPDIAAYVAANGVDQLFVDLEIMGKAERQGHLDTVRSALTTEAVSKIRRAVPDAHLLVRINPLHPGTADELDEVIDRGADTVMLPMFKDTQTLARFFDLLAGRAGALPLFECTGAIEALPEMVRELPLTGLHFGLNDLHLERGDRMMFVPLAQDVLEGPAKCLRDAGIPFGIGGVARAGEGAVPPELILGEHVRLGSTAAILSRTFHRRARDLNTLTKEMDFPAEIALLRQIYREFLAHPGRLGANRQAFRAAVDAAG